MADDQIVQANPNVLSERYVPSETNEVFSERGKNIAERELWIAVMKGQKELGVPIPGEDIVKFENAKDNVDLAMIKEIERKTRHDIKAKIETFVKTAGAGEYLHKAMTSRDLTDNVEQMQNLRASKIILGRYVGVARHMIDKVEEYRDILLTARTHHQAAQPTLFGRRMAMWADELLFHIGEMEHFIDVYPLRGIRGPVGTQFDMLSLLGSAEKVDRLEILVAKHLGFAKTLDATGQVYPRSLDYALAARLVGLAAACENFGIGVRLMSGYELCEEGFQEGQVGSSIMPHKMNTRSSERICGAGKLVKMYSVGAMLLSGDQWEEGDVSCSITRRVVQPDQFYASEAVTETTMTVLNETGVYPEMIKAEFKKYLPFLASTEMLTIATKAGIGREQAHKIIKQHAVGEAIRMRKTGELPYLANRLAQDPVFQQHGITEKQLQSVLDDTTHFIGNANKQMDAVKTKAQVFIDKYKDAAAYEPRPIL